MAEQALGIVLGLFLAFGIGVWSGYSMGVVQSEKQGTRAACEAQRFSILDCTLFGEPDDN